MHTYWHSRADGLFDVRAWGSARGQWGRVEAQQQRDGGPGDGGRRKEGGRKKGGDEIGRKRDAKTRVGMCALYQTRGTGSGVEGGVPVLYKQKYQNTGA